MSSENLCLYNKYGHCKFRDTCRHQHFNETCEETSCETKKCLKRHPRNCKFYYDFRRCKFGDYRSFSHKTLENGISAPENDLKDMKARLATLEELMEEKENKIKCINDKLNTIAEKNVKLETERNKMKWQNEMKPD